MSDIDFEKITLAFLALAFLALSVALAAREYGKAVKRNQEVKEREEQRKREAEKAEEQRKREAEKAEEQRKREAEKAEEQRKREAEKAEEQRKQEAEKAEEEVERKNEREREERERWVREHSTLQCSIEDDVIVDQQVPLDVEIFTSDPLPDGKQYMVEISGTYQYKGGWLSLDGNADARYKDNGSPNFDEAYECVHFGTERQLVMPYKEDRHMHTYLFVITGTGDKFSMILKPTGKVSRYDGKFLVVQIRLPSNAEKTTLQEEQEEQDRIAEEKRREEEELSEMRRRNYKKNWPETKFKNRAESIERQAKLAPHYLDTDYLTKYVEKHRSTLLENKEAIWQKAQEFHDDYEFIAYLQEHSPELIEWKSWEVRALAIAERTAVEPPSERKELTDEGRKEQVVRYGKRALEVEKEKADDHKARIQQRIKLKSDLEAELLEYDLDEDEREAYLKEFDDVLNQIAQDVEEDERDGHATQL